MPLETPEDVMEFADCTGKQRKFKFKATETGRALVRLEAHEIRNDGQPGYYFREIGMVGHLVLLRGNLNQKIREGLSGRYIVPQREGIGRWEMLTDELRGYVDYDDVNQETCLVMDGYKVTWDEFKALVSSHDGFFFRLRFED